MYSTHRLISDKILSIEYLGKELPTVARFVQRLVSRPNKLPSASVLKCYKILKEPGSIQAKIQAKMEATNTFLEKMLPLRNALDLFSDDKRKPMATSVAPILAQLKDEATKSNSLEDSLRYHLQRLEKQHAMNFFSNVMWLSPPYITFRDKRISPPSVDTMNDMLGNTIPMFAPQKH